MKVSIVSHLLVDHTAVAIVHKNSCWLSSIFVWVGFNLWKTVFAEPKISFICKKSVILVAIIYTFYISMQLLFMYLMSEKKLRYQTESGMSLSCTFILHLLEEHDFMQINYQKTYKKVISCK